MYVVNMSELINFNILCSELYFKVKMLLNCKILCTCHDHRVNSSVSTSEPTANWLELTSRHVSTSKLPIALLIYRSIY